MTALLAGTDLVDVRVLNLGFLGFYPEAAVPETTT
jgi:hypothetical protein